MIVLAEKLSKDTPFVRTDFYTIDNKVFFGELTFFPASGFADFNPDVIDKEMGDWLILPTVGGILLQKSNVFLFLRKGTSLNDYKVYTINGKAQLCMINQDRGMHTRADYFDRNFNWLDFTWGYEHADTIPEKPICYDLMLDLAEKLAVKTKELRVDFYQINGRVTLGS